MPRRHHRPESVHPYRWMVSYADFMTLLFAFFVVMYAISSVNNEKFESISHSLVGVFESSNKSLLPFQIDAIFPTLAPASDVSMVARKDADRPEPVGDLIELLQSSLNPLLKEERFNLQMEENWLQLEVPLDALFSSQKNELSFKGSKLLSKIAASFRGFENPINIEVFSDGQANSSESPWLLSATQGAAIVQFLALEDIKMPRLAVVAYGPFQPISTNDDEDGRSLNRRVLFLIDRRVLKRERIKTVTKRHLSAKS
ncbi:MAG: flagellar motor protein MotB [Bermanella sp.]